MRFLAWLGCLFLVPTLANPGRAQQPVARDVPVLVYHRFAEHAVDTMTVRTETMRAHLRFLEDNGYRIVPLADVLAWRAGGPDNLPPRAVVLSVDDGHRSVYEVLWPMLASRPVHVTLFIYPSAISNASYAMTWDQLRALKRTGWFDIESHSYWHPNFRIERARLAPDGFRHFAHDQLRRSRERIEAEVGAPVTLLAWPFGIHDAELEAIATQEGYVSAFTIEAGAVTRRQPAMALPRYLITDQCDVHCLSRLLAATGKQHD
ncbi:polysaccharide deacetylase family protein [Cupriavidus pinatubonensis]|nr:polysaccharide deacetylase family protein [Cupriavidus pinatubonensis]